MFELKLNRREHWPPVKRADVEKRQAAEGNEDSKAMPAAEQKRAYNRLRLFMNQNLQFEEEQFFHRMEMACTQELAGTGMRALYRAYELVSDYGWSVLRPFCGLASLWLLGCLAWMIRLYEDHITFGIAAEAAGWSFANIFAIFGFRGLYFDKANDLDEIFKFIAGSQTVFGFILLFFLGLGLRNRFRLR